MLTQEVLDNHILYLKKNKYRNKIQELKLEHCTDNKGDYIYLVQIIIKKSLRNTGYGSLVLSEVIKIANEHNVRIKLWVSGILGGDVKRLYEFYGKHGFFLIKKDNDGYMIYNPH
jgi:GNAT superfamily N-acetyltransferase